MDDMNKFFEKWSEQLLKVHHEMDLQLLGYRILFTIIEIKLFFFKYRLSEEVTVVLTSHLDYFFLEIEESNIYLLLVFYKALLWKTGLILMQQHRFVPQKKNGMEVQNPLMASSAITEGTITNPSLFTF